jgi:hypothetical protein
MKISRGPKQAFFKDSSPQIQFCLNKNGSPLALISVLATVMEVKTNQNTLVEAETLFLIFFILFQSLKNFTMKKTTRNRPPPSLERNENARLDIS